MKTPSLRLIAVRRTSISLLVEYSLARAAVTLASTNERMENTTRETINITFLLRTNIEVYDT